MLLLKLLIEVGTNCCTSYGVCDTPKPIRPIIDYPIITEDTFDELNETRPSPHSTLCNVEHLYDHNKTLTFRDDDNNEVMEFATHLSQLDLLLIILLSQRIHLMS